MIGALDSTGIELVGSDPGLEVEPWAPPASEAEVVGLELAGPGDSLEGGATGGPEAGGPEAGGPEAGGPEAEGAVPGSEPAGAEVAGAEAGGPEAEGAVPGSEPAGAEVTGAEAGGPEAEGAELGAEPAGEEAAGAEPVAKVLSDAGALTEVAGLSLGVTDSQGIVTVSIRPLSFVDTAEQTETVLTGEPVTEEFGCEGSVLPSVVDSTADEGCEEMEPGSVPDAREEDTEGTLVLVTSAGVTDSQGIVTVSTSPSPLVVTAEQMDTVLAGDGLLCGLVAGEETTEASPPGLENMEAGEEDSAGLPAEVGTLPVGATDSHGIATVSTLPSLFVETAEQTDTVLAIGEGAVGALGCADSVGVEPGSELEEAGLKELVLGATDSQGIVKVRTLPSLPVEIAEHTETVLAGTELIEEAGVGPEVGPGATAELGSGIDSETGELVATAELVLGVLVIDSHGVVTV